MKASITSAGRLTAGRRQPARKRRHGDHMNYPEYRRRGWPIGSGMTEAGVKQFNKRVKGTEQFWHAEGVEPILALRSL